MYVAFQFLLLFWVMLFYRWLTKKESVQRYLHSPWLPTPLHLLLQYYSVFYLILVFVVLIPCVWSIFVWEIDYYDWLDPNHFQIPAGLTEKERAELSIPLWLRILSLSSVMIIPIILLVTIVHTWKHVQCVRTRNQVERPHIQFAMNTPGTISHDLALHVIALPVVYGIMSMRSTDRSWMIMTASGRGAHLSPGEYRLRQQDEIAMYESNFEIADLYEAWSLWCFSKLCVAFVQARLEAPRVVCSAIHGGALLNRLVKGLLATNSQLSKSLEGITLLGLNYFVAFNILQSTFLVMSRVMAKASMDPCKMSPYFCLESIEPYLSGASFIVSTIAISNIVSFEHSFAIQLKEFDPTWKFWGVKILVSIAFIQKMVLSFVFQGWAGYSTVQVDLMYSSLITLELLPIAIIMWRAWDPQRQWCKPDVVSVPHGFTEVPLQAAGRSLLASD